VSGRIWPGALCEIVRSDAGNEGRRVVAETLCGPDRWIVQPLQPLRSIYALDIGGGRVWEKPGPLVMDRCRFRGSWLRPITDPPGTDCTDDRAPCETEAA